MVEGRVLRRAADGARVPATRRDATGRRKGPAPTELRVALVSAAGAGASGPAGLEEGRIPDLVVTVVTPTEELPIGQNSTRVEPACYVDLSLCSGRAICRSASGPADGLLCIHGNNQMTRRDYLRSRFSIRHLDPNRIEKMCIEVAAVRRGGLHSSAHMLISPNIAEYQVHLWVLCCPYCFHF